MEVRNDYNICVVSVRHYVNQLVYNTPSVLSDGWILKKPCVL